MYIKQLGCCIGMTLFVRPSVQITSSTLQRPISRSLLVQIISISCYTFRYSWPCFYLVGWLCFILVSFYFHFLGNLHASVATVCVIIYLGVRLYMSLTVQVSYCFTGLKKESNGRNMSCCFLFYCKLSYYHIVTLFLYTN